MAKNQKRKKTEIQKGQIDPRMTNKKMTPTTTRSTRNKSAAPKRPPVRQLDTISAGNKNNAYGIPGKKQQLDIDTEILQEKKAAAISSADKAIGRTYRAVKKRATTQKKAMPAKKAKIHKYPQGFSQSLCPIKEIKFGIIHTTSGMYVKILEILPIDYNSLSIQEKNDVIENYRRVFENTSKEFHLKIINDTNNPNRIIEHIKQKCEEEKYQRGISKKVIACAQDKIDFIKELSEKMSITTRYFLIYKYDGKSNDINDIFSELESLRIHYTNVFRSMGNTVVEYDSLTEDTFKTADILYYFYNRTTYRKESLQSRINRITSDCALYNKTHADKRDVYDGDFIAAKGIKFTNSEYVFQDGVYKTWLAINRDAHPSRAEATWINNFTNYGAGNELDVYIRKLPKETAKYLISKKGDVMNLILAPYMIQSSSRWKDFAPKAANTNMIIKELEGEEDFFKVSIIITLSSPTLRGLQSIKKQVLQDLKSLKIKTDDCWQRTYEYFMATLPLMEMPYSLFENINHNYFTKSLQTLYPFTAYEINHPSGYVLGVREGLDSIVCFDSFNTSVVTNGNIALIGGSGSGKTYTSEIIARSMRLTGMRTMFILPVKGFEYLRGCKELGGSFIRIGPGSKDNINVMGVLLRPAQSIDKDLIVDDIAYKEVPLLTGQIAFLTTWLQLLNSNIEFTPQIFSTISSVLTDLYSTFGITTDNNSIWLDKKKKKLKPLPLISDMYNAFMEVSLLEPIATILLEFVNGAFKNFNRQTNVDLDNNYICFDVDESKMQKKYLASCLYIIFQYCYSVAKQNRLHKDVIFFDEVWKMMINDACAEQVKDIAKLIRGYGGGVVFATQELADFMGNPYGPSILANCDTRLILKLKDTELPFVTKHIILSHAEQKKILNSDRGHALLLAGRNRVRVNICASQMEDRAYTTDINRLKQYAREESQSIMS